MGASSALSAIEKRLIRLAACDIRFERDGGRFASCVCAGRRSSPRDGYFAVSLLAKRSASNARGKRRGILPSQNAAATSIPRDISAGDSMQLKYRNRKIRTFVRERSQRFGICSQLKMRLAQLREAPDIRSVSAIGNCHRLQKNRHIEADMMALHVTANWRLCFKVHPTCLEIVDVCDYH